MTENPAKSDYRATLERIGTMNGGEEIYWSDKSIMVILPDNRNSTSTSFLNGGYQENLKDVFNHEPDPARFQDYPDIMTILDTRDEILENWMKNRVWCVKNRRL